MRRERLLADVDAEGGCSARDLAFTVAFTSLHFGFTSIMESSQMEESSTSLPTSKTAAL
jgi:hypothetical protein